MPDERLERTRRAYLPDDRDRGPGLYYGCGKHKVRDNWNGRYCPFCVSEFNVKPQKGFYSQMK